MNGLHVGASAAAIAAIRTRTAQRTGCPEWDPAGIAHALTATEGTPGSVLAAAALAAEDPALNKPSPRGFTNHWPVNATSSRPNSHGTPCPDHPEHNFPCPACKNERPDPQVTAAGIATVRAAMAEAGITKEPK